MQQLSPGNCTWRPNHNAANKVVVSVFSVAQECSALELKVSSNFFVGERATGGSYGYSSSCALWAVDSCELLAFKVAAALGVQAQRERWRAAGS